MSPATKAKPSPENSKPLSSLLYPPLGRDDKKRCRTYLASGIVKLLLAMSITSLVIATAVLGDKFNCNRDSNQRCEKMQRVETVVSSAFGIIVAIPLFISGVLDSRVYFFTMRNVQDPGTYPDKTFLVPGFRHVHHAATHASRASLIIGCIFGCLPCVPKPSNISICDQLSNHAGTVSGHCLSVIRMQEAYFYLGVLATFSYHITGYLWTSGILMTYGLLNFVRLVCGVFALNFAVRCLAGVELLSNGSIDSFNALPAMQQSQALLMFRWILASGFTGGCMGVGLGVFGLSAFWRRSKLWILTDAFVTAVSIFPLVATFLSLLLVNEIRQMFCNYALLFAQDLEFGSIICNTVSKYFNTFAMYACVLCLTLVDILTVATVFLINTHKPPREFTQAHMLELADLLQQLKEAPSDNHGPEIKALVEDEKED